MLIQIVFFDEGNVAARCRSVRRIFLAPGATENARR
jgi:hypothetical protein